MERLLGISFGERQLSFLELREMTRQSLLFPTEELRRGFEANIAAVESVEPTIFHFSLFRDDHLERALLIAEKYMEVADSAIGQKGLELALREYGKDLERENPDLVYYAWLVFTTHHPKGRLLSDVTPRLAAREPEKVAPSSQRESAAAENSPVFNGGALPNPDGLEWFREDPFANEHHEHWHVVYPNRGVPNKKGPRGWKMKDRHGELFFYMHEQMIARYDAERIALNLERVSPLKDYRQAIEIGYDPGELFSQSFAKREPNMLMSDINSPDLKYKIEDHELRRDRIAKAIETGNFDNTTPVTPVDVDKLGLTIEAARGTVSPPPPGTLSMNSHYGSLHNMGHNVIAMIANPTSDEAPPGVMSDPATSIRDPIFYRWHKHIDDANFALQEKLKAYDFQDRPYVEVRKSYADNLALSGDIILSFVDQLPASAPGSGLEQFGEHYFGGDNWDKDFDGDQYTTPELQTRMTSREIVLADRTTKVQVEHLVHREFVYFLRVENKLKRHYTVTARIFLVPKALAEDRRAWIEMDKFLYELQPLERAVIARRGKESSVIRKPAEMQPELLKGDRFKLTEESFQRLVQLGVPQEVIAALLDLKDHLFENFEQFSNKLQSRLNNEQFQNFAGAILNSAFFDSEKPVLPFLRDGTIDPRWREYYNYCTCGWPYNLLVPRGTTDGMDFRIMVMFTDWTLDQVGPEGACGSVSFCGAIEKYPDKQPMGYPFDRPFDAPITIADTIMSNMNMAFRDIKIRRLEGEPND